MKTNTVNKNKKPINKKKCAIISALLLVLIGSAGVGSYLYLNSNQKPSGDYETAFTEDIPHDDDELNAIAVENGFEDFEDMSRQTLTPMFDALASQDSEDFEEKLESTDVASDDSVSSTDTYETSSEKFESVFNVSLKDEQSYYESIKNTNVIYSNGYLPLIDCEPHNVNNLYVYSYEDETAYDEAVAELNELGYSFITNDSITFSSSAADSDSYDDAKTMFESIGLYDGYFNSFVSTDTSLDSENHPTTIANDFEIRHECTSVNSKGSKTVDNMDDFIKYCDEGYDVTFVEKFGDVEANSGIRYEQTIVVLDSAISKDIAEKYGIEVYSLIDDNPYYESTDGSMSHADSVIESMKLIAQSDTHIILYEILDDDGLCGMPELIDGVLKSVEDNASVVNISFGTSSDDEALGCVIGDIMAYAANSGTIPVCAAGNSGKSIYESNVYPASCGDVVSVSSIESTDSGYAYTQYSNTGADVSTFGVSPDGKTGTSFSTAYVSAMTAAIMSTDLYTTVSDIETVYYNSFIPETIGSTNVITFNNFAPNYTVEDTNEIIETVLSDAVKNGDITKDDLEKYKDVYSNEAYASIFSQYARYGDNTKAEGKTQGGTNPSWLSDSGYYESKGWFKYATVVLNDFEHSTVATYNRNGNAGSFSHTSPYIQDTYADIPSGSVAAILYYKNGQGRIATLFCSTAKLSGGYNYRIVNSNTKNYGGLAGQKTGQIKGYARFTYSITSGGNGQVVCTLSNASEAQAANTTTSMDIGNGASVAVAALTNYANYIPTGVSINAGTSGKVYLTNTTLVGRIGFQGSDLCYTETSGHDVTYTTPTGTNTVHYEDSHAAVTKTSAITVSKSLPNGFYDNNYSTTIDGDSTSVSAGCAHKQSEANGSVSSFTVKNLLAESSARQVYKQGSTASVASTSARANDQILQLFLCINNTLGYDFSASSSGNESQAAYFETSNSALIPISATTNEYVTADFGWSVNNNLTNHVMAAIDSGNHDYNYGELIPNITATYRVNLNANCDDSSYSAPAYVEVKDVPTYALQMDTKPNNNTNSERTLYTGGNGSSQLPTGVTSNDLYIKALASGSWLSRDFVSYTRTRSQQTSINGVLHGGQSGQRWFTVIYDKTEMQLPVPHRDGYICIGWSDSPNGTSNGYTYKWGYQAASSGELTGNYPDNAVLKQDTLYAVWVPITYNIVYEANVPSDTSLTPTSAQPVAGTTEDGYSYSTGMTIDEVSMLTTNVPLAKCQYQVSGYDFVGWEYDRMTYTAYDASGGITYTNGSYTSSSRNSNKTTQGTIIDNSIGEVFGDRQTIYNDSISQSTIYTTHALIKNTGSLDGLAKKPVITVYLKALWGTDAQTMTYYGNGGTVEKDDSNNFTNTKGTVDPVAGVYVQDTSFDALAPTNSYTLFTNDMTRFGKKVIQDTTVSSSLDTTDDNSYEYTITNSKYYLHAGDYYINSDGYVKTFQGWSTYSNGRWQDRLSFVGGETISVLSLYDKFDATIFAPYSNSLDATDMSTLDCLKEYSKDIIDRISNIEAALSYTGDLPYGADNRSVRLYAVWDAFPTIEARNLYVAEDDIASITPKYLIEHINFSDLEDGEYDGETFGNQILTQMGDDWKTTPRTYKATYTVDGSTITTEAKTVYHSSGDEVTYPGGESMETVKSAQGSIEIIDYDFNSMQTAVENEVTSISVTFKCTDTAGNETYRTINVFISDSDTDMTKYETVRFISKDSLDTLNSNSIWVKDAEYTNALNSALDRLEVLTSTLSRANSDHETPYDTDVSSSFNDDDSPWVYDIDTILDNTDYLYVITDINALNDKLKTDGVGNMDSLTLSEYSDVLEDYRIKREDW